MLLFDVRKDFLVCVDHLTTQDAEVLQKIMAMKISCQDAKALVLGHPNKEIFLANLCQQVLVYEKRFRVGINNVDRNMIIAAATQIYVNQILEVRRQAMLSNAEKGRIESKAQLVKDVGEILKEVDDASGTAAKGA